jgi:hypothetical protein
MTRAAVQAVRAALGRAGWWRIAVAIVAAAMCILTFLTAPGGVAILPRAPVSLSTAGTELPAWARPCLRQTPAHDHRPLAFCARVRGRVLASRTTARNGERHLLVAGGFHLTLVEMPDTMPAPGWGSVVTAVGPLLSGSYGLREVRATWVHGG